MHSLSSRVTRLEKIVLARPPAPCPSCGTPKGWVAGFVIQDPDGKSFHDQRCTICGVETMGGKAISAIDPNKHGYREVLVLPAGSPPLPV